ncbi:MAG: hypothetical protein GY862_17320 [Gammaproteobacteria bacterium]|nr:hypothetical protein [Gammaproteobacteria bacterium]
MCAQFVHTKPETREVRADGYISFVVKGYGSQDYDVRHIGVNVKDKVLVTVNILNAPNINVTVTDREGVETTHICTPAERDRGGFPLSKPVFGEEHHKTVADTDREKRKKQMLKTAHEVETLRDADKKRKAREPAFPGIDPMKTVNNTQRPAYMNRPGTMVNTARRKAEVRPLQYPGVIMDHILPAINRRLSAEENRAIRTQYPDGVPEADLEALITRLRGDHKPPVLRVAGG